jgi:hypothetical protein
VPWLERGPRSDCAHSARRPAKLAAEIRSRARNRTSCFAFGESVYAASRRPRVRLGVLEIVSHALEMLDTLTSPVWRLESEVGQSASEVADRVVSD